MKKQEANKKHKLLHVVITDANTGETLVDEKTMFVGGVGLKEEKGFSFVLGGGTFLEHFVLVSRLRALADKIEGRARKKFTLEMTFSGNMEPKEGE